VIKSIRITKILKTLALIAGVFFVLATVGYFALRNYLLHAAIEKVANKLDKKYSVKFEVKEAGFSGISNIYLKNITVTPAAHDTLLSVESIETGVQLWYALFLDIRLSNLQLQNGYLNLVKDERGRNIDAFLQASDSSEKEENTNTTGERNLAKTAYKLISKVLNFIPADVNLKKVALKIKDNGHLVVFDMQQLVLSDENLTSDIMVIDAVDSSQQVVQNWKIQGIAKPRKKVADVSFYNTDTGKVLIPYVKERFNLTAGFDSIRLKLDEVDLDDQVLRIKGLAGTTNFLINHPKIARKDVVIEQASFNYHFNIGANFIEIDSSSAVQFNKIKVVPFVRYQRGPDTTYQINVTIAQTQAQDFIYSLPEGLFTHFQGMEAEGSFSYRLDFLYNENHPRDLVFDSRLEKNGLRITRYGEANLSKLNEEFTYTPLENGRPQRPIVVGVSNPEFIPLEQISPLLRKSVLTTEDPSFFYHRGFIDEAFRQSIIKNIRKRTFARGASTISMQLVKNVFLTREKTLSRKLEEILLVYILENNRLSSKERMFEVYLNIIEWGPGVYGIGEAARYYFNKSADNLTLSEALYLAVIIPSPKKFMWRFGKDGELKEHVGRHFRSLAGLMIRRNVLMPEDTVGLTHHIQITGPAKNLIKVTVADSLVNDSIYLDENGILLNTEEDE